jgi:hypothetical protein
LQLIPDILAVSLWAAINAADNCLAAIFVHGSVSVLSILFETLEA